jgi:2-dehydro-3-deoxyphosphogluconate aldolase/(4S)-4-hydroxy-2-oxoglutarate aldolase
MKMTDTLALLRKVKVVPVVRTSKVENAVRASQWLAESGLSVIELTTTIPDVFDGVAQLRRQGGLTIGVGTLLSAQDARQAVTAGAQFLVTPCWVDGVIEVAERAGLASFIGAATASEIWRAHMAGATAVKIFPAATLGGPQFLRQVRSVFPHVLLMPTGGVTAETAADYLKAGAICVGVGSELTPAKALETGDKAAVIDRAKRLMEMLANPPTLHV